MTENIKLAKYEPPVHDGLELLYHDDSMLVLNKPSGLLSVPGRGEDKQDSLATRVQAEYPEAKVVHRLDMETSGVMIMARGEEMHRELNRLFEQRQVRKIYVAIVDGRVADARGEINLPLIADWPNRPLQKVDMENGKPSKTFYTVLWRNIEEGTTRVELEPQTGRSHQLRVHMQSLGHPILGDALYADKTAQEKAKRLLLHALSLSFIHPFTKAPMRILSDLPF